MKIVRFYTEAGNMFEGDPENAGYDLKAAHDVIIQPGERTIVKTGLYTEFSNDLQLEIRSRSGLAAKNGIIVLNAPGTIDASYRGEIGVILYNTSKETFEVKKGDRIAQGVFMPAIHPMFVQVESKEKLSETKRGAGGFGHTGK